jgi:hypothetical protein
MSKKLDVLVEIDAWKKHFKKAGAHSFGFILDVLENHEKRLRKLEQKDGRQE